MKYTIELAQPSGPRVTYNIRRHEGPNRSRAFTREYTWAEAVEVMDWMNGRDQPLATMNMDDYPKTIPDRARVENHRRTGEFWS